MLKITLKVINNVKSHATQRYICNASSKVGDNSIFKKQSQTTQVQHKGVKQIN